MTRKAMSGGGLPKASPLFSHAVRCAGLVFVSGTTAYDPATGALVGDTIGAQVAQSLRNISAILAAAGTSPDRAVSATILLADEDGFPGMNAEWIQWFPTDPPARRAASCRCARRTSRSPSP